jgi:hypothetical protein
MSLFQDIAFRGRQLFTWYQMFILSVSDCHVKSFHNYHWFFCEQTTLRVWDVLFNEGAKVLFHVALAIFKVCTQKIAFSVWYLEFVWIPPACLADLCYLFS